jgi:hypothetical protein
LVPGKRYSVFSIRTTKKHETIWVRAGIAYVNADDSMNLYLDVLPMEGQLHVRETGNKSNTTHHNPPQRHEPKEQQQPAPSPETPGAYGGH